MRILLPMILVVALNQGIHLYAQYRFHHVSETHEPEIEITMPEIPTMSPEWQAVISTEPLEPQALWWDDALWEAKYSDVGERMHACMADTAYLLRESTMSEGDIRGFLDGWSHRKEDINDALELFAPDWNLRAAQCVPMYLQSFALSKASVTSLLVDSGFTEEQARWGIENCDVDWEKMAARAVLENLRNDPRGAQDLIEDMVEFEGFTREEAEAGIAAAEIDWEEIASADAMQIQEDYPRGPKRLEEYLVLQGYGEEIARELPRSLPIDWADIALRVVRNCSWDGYTREEVMNELIAYQGFNQEDALYAVKIAGIQ